MNGDPGRSAGEIRRLAIGIATSAAVLGAGALAIEAHDSVTRSLHDGKGLAEAAFLYLRFFTVLTNLGLVALQAATAWRLLRRRLLPPGRVYGAALVYAVVTCVTYEVLLRGLWSPQGWMFAADVVLHDVAPSLILCTWLLAAPRRGVSWRDPLAMLAFPAAYLVVTLVAGAWGEGYPYNFLNVDEIGLRTVLLVSLGFLGIFLVLGIVVTAAALLRPRTVVAEVPCTSSS